MLVRYALAWLVVGAALAGAAIAVLGRAPDARPLPPMRETELVTATRKAGCALRRAPETAAGLTVSGPAARPAAPRVHDEPAANGALVGALRRGLVVIHHRPDLPAGDLAGIAALQAVVPRGTVVTPNPRMPYAVAAAAWRRLLTCRSFGRPATDAIRLFRGRYIGSGPEAAR